MGEEVVASSGESGDQTAQILAELEVMMMDEGFNAKVDSFTQQHCEQFDEGEENKLICKLTHPASTHSLSQHSTDGGPGAWVLADTSLFTEYTKMLEAYIEQHLGATLDDFDMQTFCASLSTRDDKEALPLALEMLSAYGDFEAFKAMMVSCKRGASLGDMGVVGAPVRVFTEEQEDGEEMPDLNLSISGLNASA